MTINLSLNGGYKLRFTRAVEELKGLKGLKREKWKAAKNLKFPTTNPSPNGNKSVP
jgi:hypothetical protein